MHLPQNPIVTAPNSTLVCYCAGVTKGAVLAAIAAGHTSIPALKQATGLCPTHTTCQVTNPHKRCCCPEVAALLESMR